MALLGAGLLALLSPAAKSRSLISGGPAAEDDTRSLRDAIVDAKGRNQALHIVFVHGIRAEGAGTSTDFAKHLAKAIEAPPPGPAMPHLLNLGTRPTATMPGDYDGTGPVDTPIWRSDPEWDASRPFVNRTTIAGELGSVVIDEYNYWPLLFPIKCRFLLVPEHDLSGNDAVHLKLCKDNGWITPADLKTLLGSRPASGGGAKLNAVAKHQIMNWGLSDAVVALGPMQAYLHSTLDQAFDYALEGAAPDQEYVVVSESLGSFVVLDAYAAKAPSVKALLDRTADLYFFANQFALLELGRMKLSGAALTGGPGFVAGGVPVAQPQRSPMSALVQWGASRESPNLAGRAGLPKQVIAFSDPSDLLTYRMPRLDNVTVVNLYDRNEGDLFGLFANPLKAHVGHVGNKAVWKFLMRRTRFSKPE
jgi:hypothetical protein